MGNNICGIDEEKKQNLQPESKVILSKTLNNVRVDIIQADVVEELTDVLVNAAHEPSDSYIQRRDRNTKIREKLASMKVGDTVSAESENVNATEICHVKLPLYQDPRDLYKIFTAYTQCLHIKGYRIISFTEQSTPNFAIPKQYLAEVLIRAILTAAQEGMDFEHVKFVTLDQLTLKYFAYELVRQLDEQRIPELFQKRIESFMHFITTNEVPCNEVYLLSTGLTSEQDQ